MWPPALWLQQHEVIRRTWARSSPRNHHQPTKNTKSFDSHSCQLPKQPGCLLHRFYSQWFSLQYNSFFTKENSNSPCFTSKKGGCGALQSQGLFPISTGSEHRSLQTWEGEEGRDRREGKSREQSVNTYTLLF